MGERFVFDYYYGLEAEQFSFIRVPRALFTEKHFMGLSSDAKLLYGIMLERMGLSWKNHWIEEDTNRVYIVFTIREVCEKLNCGKDKAVKVLAELDSEKGIGLIERQRKGLGRPDTIYVKNFVAVMDEKGSANPDGCTEFGKTEFKSSVFPPLIILILVILMRVILRGVIPILSIYPGRAVRTMD